MIDGSGPRAGQDLLQGCLVQVPKRDVPLVVQTARHHRAVPQYAHLVPQAVAEAAALLLWSGQVGPLEFLSKLQVNARGQGGPPPGRPPGPGKCLPEPGEDLAVLTVGPLGLRPIQVPQTQGAPLPRPGRRPGKGDAPIQIALQVLPCPAVALKGVDGDAHLLHRRTAQQQRLPLTKQSSVGGEHHPEAQGVRLLQQDAQLRMEQRLPHQVEVQVIRVGPQAARQGPEALRRQKARHTPGAGTKITGQVAHIGDLQIGLPQPPHSAFLLLQPFFPSPPFYPGVWKYIS